MSDGVHPFVIRIPYQLWQQLLKYCGRRQISAFIIEAVREKLEREQEGPSDEQ